MRETDKMLILFFLISSLFFTGLFYLYAGPLGFIDIPNDRSSHTEPTPRAGGIVFISLWVSYYVYAVSKHLPTHRQDLPILIGIMLVACVSLMDDRRGVDNFFRLMLHLVTAFLISFAIIFSHHDVDPLNFFSISFLLMVSTLGIAWSINLFNFMDGLDGFAALEALCISCCGGFLFHWFGGAFYARASWVLAATITGFIFWNKPKAKIFMGDVGSASLGLIMASFALIAIWQYHTPLLLWLMLGSVFIFDASVTLMRRIMLGHKWLDAHKLHAYQRLQQSGWSHAQVLMGLFIINLLIMGLVYLSLIYPQLLMVNFTVNVCLLALIYIGIEYKRPMRNRESVR